jgi:hypothetical protein
MMRPYNPHSILILRDDGVTGEWSIGAVGWLRALTDAEVAAAIHRLLSVGRPTRILEATLAADRIWASGHPPKGTPVGLARGPLHLPTAEEYARNGWLSPDALAFFPCGEAQHEDLAEALHQHGSIGLDAAGWLRIKDFDGVAVANRTQESWLRAPCAMALGQ